MIKLHTVKKRAKILCAFFINTIFPIECVSCKKEDVWICDKCVSEVKLNTNFFCPSCSSPNNYGTVCSRCKSSFYFDGVWIAGEYRNKILSSLIKTYKYNYAKDISSHLGTILFQFLMDIFKQAALSSFLSEKKHFPNEFKNNNYLPEIMITPSYHSILIPVPLHKKRLKWRGFNQSELLAKIVAKKSDIKIDTTSLIKTRHNKPQINLGAIERRENVIDSYKWNGERIDGKNIILIDDVLTTGSTLNECARVLKEAGANEVWGLVLAKN